MKIDLYKVGPYYYFNFYINSISYISSWHKLNNTTLIDRVNIFRGEYSNTRKFVGKIDTNSITIENNNYILIKSDQFLKDFTDQLPEEFI